MSVFKVYQTKEKPNKRKIVNIKGKSYFKSLDETSIDATNKYTISKHGNVRTISINPKSEIKDISDLIRKPAQALTNIQKFRTVLYSRHSIQYSNGDFHIIPINEILKKPPINLYWRERKTTKIEEKQQINYTQEGRNSLESGYKNHYLFGSYHLISVPVINPMLACGRISIDTIEERPIKKIPQKIYCIESANVSKHIDIEVPSLGEQMAKRKEYISWFNQTHTLYTVEYGIREKRNTFGYTQTCDNNQRIKDEIVIKAK